MMNGRKPASPFGNMGQGQGQAPAGQYGANASPNGNAWGQQFMQQYGAPPGQMKDQWNAYRQENGFGQGNQMAGAGGQPAPGMPQQQNMQNPMQGWLAQRPQFGGMGGMGGGMGPQQPNHWSMMQAWLAQRPRGLLG